MNYTIYSQEMQEKSTFAKIRRQLPGSCLLEGYSVMLNAVSHTDWPLK